MANLLNFTLTVEDLLGPKVAAAVQRVQALHTRIEAPHRLNVDASGASSSLFSLKNLVGGLVGSLGLLGAANWLAGTVTDFNAAAQSTAQFDATLASTRGAVGLTRTSLLAMSDALMGKSLFDDDALTQAQSVLLTFTNVRGAIYEKALPAITDLATKMGGDLQGATVQVGKALNDPIAGISALSRVGVSFTEGQKKTIKSLVETGQTAKAQQLILKELNTEFGGSAEAATKAGTGGMTVLANKLGNLRERIGGLIVSGLNRLQPLMDRALTGFNGLLDLVEKTPAFLEEYKVGLVAVGIAVAALGAESLILTAIQKGQALWTTATTAAQWALNVALTANPIGLVVAGVALLIGGLVLLYKKTETVRGGINGLVAGAKSAFTDLAKAGLKILGGVGKIIRGIFTLDKDEIGRGLAEAAAGIGEALPARIAARAGKAAGTAYRDGVLAVRAEKAQSAKEEKDKKAKDLLGDLKTGAAPVPALPKTMTAAASAGVSGAGAGRVMNIKLEVREMLNNMRVTVGSAEEGAARIGQLIRDTVLAELNDVMTLTSE